jgi:hypothetical protein
LCGLHLMPQPAVAMRSSRVTLVPWAARSEISKEF